MGQAATGNEFETAREAETIIQSEVGTLEDALGERDPLLQPPTQAPDTPSHDENKDGLTGGQATADVTGDILGV